MGWADGDHFGKSTSIESLQIVTRLRILVQSWRSTITKRECSIKKQSTQSTLCVILQRTVAEVGQLSYYITWRYIKVWIADCIEVHTHQATTRYVKVRTADFTHWEYVCRCQPSLARLAQRCPNSSPFQQLALDTWIWFYLWGIWRWAHFLLLTSPSNIFPLILVSVNN